MTEKKEESKLVSTRPYKLDALTKIAAERAKYQTRLISMQAKEAKK